VFHGCAYAISVEQPIEIKAYLETKYQNIRWSEMFEQKLCVQGQHQTINAGLAYTAVQTLLKHQHIMGDMDTCQQAIAHVSIMGRLQCIAYQQATIYLDAAHNRHAVEALLTSLDVMQPLDAILVYTRDDRNLGECFELLKPFTAQLMSDRDSKYLTVCIKHVEEALEHVLNQNPEAHILVLGSFLTVAASLHWMKMYE
ncbi:MAG: hypothetical protein Q9M10_06045, partial [Mariprofundaceae bacterium]|nr:hypothetical protein [Mariprofundaceae bacterium]